MLYIEAHLASYHSVIRPVVCATYGPCLSYVMDVALSDYNVVNVICTDDGGMSIAR